MTCYVCGKPGQLETFRGPWDHVPYLMHPKCAPKSWQKRSK